jgi:hypothetical protein
MNDKPKAQQVERQTEDEMARASLGGTKGSRELADAPMTPQREKKTPKNDEHDGHVA